MKFHFSAGKLLFPPGNDGISATSTLTCLGSSKERRLRKGFVNISLTVIYWETGKRPKEHLWFQASSMSPPFGDDVLNVQDAQGLCWHSCGGREALVRLRPVSMHSPRGQRTHSPRKWSHLKSSPGEVLQEILSHGMGCRVGFMEEVAFKPAHLGYSHSGGQGKACGVRRTAFYWRQSFLWWLL